MAAGTYDQVRSHREGDAPSVTYDDDKDVNPGTKQIFTILSDCYSSLTDTSTSLDQLESTINKLRILDTWTVQMPALIDSEALENYDKAYRSLKAKSTSNETIELFNSDKAAFARELRAILQEWYNEIVKLVARSGIAWMRERELNIQRMGVIKK